MKSVKKDKSGGFLNKIKLGQNLNKLGNFIQIELKSG